MSSQDKWKLAQLEEEEDKSRHETEDGETPKKKLKSL